MKIAVLTSGILPVPAVQGGAVENLIDMYLAYNDRHKLHDITVYSVDHPDVHRHPALKSEVNHYRYIDTGSLLAKVRKRVYKLLRGDGYYHYTVEYYLEQALRHIRSTAYDMMIVENRPGFALRIGRGMAARLVLHLHNDMLNDSVPRCREVYQQYSRIVTVSDFIASRVKTIDPTDKKCVTVHNGLDLQRFSPERAVCADRSRFGLADDDFVLMFTGRVIPEKGIAQLVEAMKLLKDEPRIKLLVLGSPFYANETTENAFIGQLKASARELGSQLLFTGYTPYAEIPSMLMLADVAVLPSVWDEPLGMTGMEAMAMGVPVITTNKGGITEVVPPDAAVILPVDEQLPLRIAQAVRSLCHDAGRRKAMGRAALKAAQQHSAEVYARAFFVSGS